MNKCIFVGFLGKKGVEFKTTPTGKFVATYSLSLQTQEKGKYEFPNIVTWGNDAEFLKNNEDRISKLAITARVSTRNYEKDGRKVYVTEFVSEPYGIEVVEWKNDDQKAITDNDGFTEVDSSDELPF